MILALLLQAAATNATPPPAPVAPSVPQRFSILADPCARTSDDGRDIVVCGSTAASSPRLSLPDERGPPDRPVASNPDLSAVRALALENTPCAVALKGCQVGIGPPIMPIARAAVGAVKTMLAKKPDKRGRVPISLDDPPPGHATP